MDNRTGNAISGAQLKLEHTCFVVLRVERAFSVEYHVAGHYLRMTEIETWL